MFFKNLRTLVLRSTITLSVLVGMLGGLPAKPVHAATLLVTTTNANGTGSLSEAIGQAASGDTIMFDPSLAGRTITLPSSIIILKDLTIDGSGLFPQVTISGGNTAQVFLVLSGRSLTISDLTIANGYSTGSGGAIQIESFVDLKIFNSTLRNNHADGNGGAIHGFGSKIITIDNSILAENESGNDGGAISAGNLTINNSTLSNNRAMGDGGTILSYFQLTLRNSAIYQNEAGHDGGAISIVGADPRTIVNSTISHNQAERGGSISITGSLSLDIFNSTFAENNATSGASEFFLSGGSLGLANTIIACTPANSNCLTQIGSSPVSETNSIIGTGTLAEFGLSELADHGGSTQTMALLPGSPLIDAGDDAICANTLVNNLDQRGVTRPQGNHCDIGAYEYQDTTAPTVLSITRANENPTSAASVDFTVTFSEPVTDVDKGDFTLNATGNIMGTTIENVTGSGATRTVTVYTGFGSGALGLDVPVGASVTDLLGNSLGSLPFTEGEIYTLDSDERENITMNRLGDFNGDGMDDVAVFRPSNGAWYISTLGNFVFGQAGDIPVPGDYNGDRRDDIAVYRPSDGTWYISSRGNFHFGEAGDIPVPADYDGNGTTDIAVYRPSNGTWYISTRGIFTFGQAGDIPIPGDYDGNGTADIAVYRPSNGTWYISSRGNFVFGQAGDVPIPGDYNRDGTTDIAVFRPSNGTWYISSRGNFVFGQAGDLPLPGDFNGDGMADVAVFRPSNGMWYISTRGNFVFGQAGDIPV